MNGYPTAETSRPRRARLIGGPKHGEIIVIQSDRFVVPVRTYDSYGLYFGKEGFSPSDVFPYTEVIYERRKLDLGGYARIEVWAPRDISEPEFQRRLADIIEGVDPMVKR